MQDTVDNVIDELDVDALRAGTWALLGRLLAAAPDDVLRQRLIAVGEDHHGGDGPPADDAMTRAWAALAEAVHSAEPAALAEEFQDVFIGVGGGQVTPYASWYLVGALMDRPLVRLREDLAALGLERQVDCSEPEDHVAALCEIMALVIQDGEVDFDWEQDIFTRYVGSWMLRLFDDIAAAPSAKVYRAVAALGKAFVEQEQRFYAMPA